MNLKSTFSKSLGVLAILFSIAFSGFSQVTSSAISGKVTDQKGEAMPGATVVAIHQPSGSKYGSITDLEGRYFLPSVRVGGPYEVSVTFVGFEKQSKGGVIANLGSTANVNFSLKEDGQLLEEVVVRSSKSDVFSSERTGAATTIGKEQIESMPTVGRSINDFTRMTPQSSGKSFSGQDSRLNNITIDGAVFNNGFGLGDQPGARTGVAPISLDAIEEIQVNVAPYDVRQSGFTGAGVNAVTKSGTNEFSGSLFYLTQKNSKSFFGSKVQGEELPINYPSKEVMGFRLGGPLIKNKLFFFVNGEFEKFSSPATTWVANRGQSGSNVTRVLATDLDRVSAQMEKLGFATGPYENFNLETVGNKFLARIDWNISDKHKFNLRYSLLDGGSDNNISNSNSAGFGPRRTVSDAMSYKNSGYILNEDISSLIGELNSTLSNKLANSLIIGFTSNNEDRATYSPQVPTIDIQEGGSTYISSGFDPFTPNNLLNYKTLQFSDNLTYFAGKHTLTAGIAVEKFQSNNSFYAASNGVFVFNSVDDFFTATNAYLANPANPGENVTTKRFEYRYGFSGGAVPPLQVIKGVTPGIYFQDDYQVTDRFKIMAGLRVDIPILEQTALENTYVSGVTYKDENGSAVKYNTGVLPSGNPLWSPRLGFNFDVKGDRTTQLRGGTGIFTGRPPYVWLSNQVGNNGVLSGFTRVDNTKAYPFTLDPSKYTPSGSDPYAAGTTFDIAVADENYKFPQVWRTNIALDQKLPGGFIGTAEFIFNQNVNAVYYINANQKDPVGKFSGPDDRLRYNGNSSANRLDSRTVRNIVLKSTNQGFGYSSTVKIERPTTKGLYVMAAYNFGVSKDLMSAGSIASGSFEGNSTVNGNNKPELSFSNNDQRHRIISSLSYKLDYGKSFGGSTQFSLFYEGLNQGRYSYVYNGDMNQDGISNNDLIYIPNSASELKFLALTSGGKTFSPEEQAAAFDKFIAQDPYLNSNKGTYSIRNGAMLPWVHQVDLGIVQNININAGGVKNTLQVRFDILNFGNMLNQNWGTYNNFVQNRILSAAGVDANGVPQYRLATQSINGATELVRDSFLPSISTASVWRGQLGLRYIFN